MLIPRRILGIFSDQPVFFRFCCLFVCPFPLAGSLDSEMQGPGFQSGEEMTAPSTVGRCFLCARSVTKAALAGPSLGGSPHLCGGLSLGARAFPVLLTRRLRWPSREAAPEGQRAGAFGVLASPTGRALLLPARRLGPSEDAGGSQRGWAEGPLGSRPGSS